MTLTSVETIYEHIIFNKKGVPIIVGTSMKVIELVLGKIAYGWSPEELHFQYPHLTLGQIHAALAYYCDHQEELDRDIKQRFETVDRIQGSTESSPLVLRLKSKGLI